MAKLQALFEGIAKGSKKAENHMIMQDLLWYLFLGTRFVTRRLLKAEAEYLLQKYRKCKKMNDG